MHFCGFGPSKHLEFAYVYVGFRAVVPKSPFRGQKCTFGGRNAKNGGIPPFLVKWRWHFKNRSGTLKKDQETIGLRKGSGKREMVIFIEIPTFCAKRALLGRKVLFLVNFRISSGKVGLNAKKCTFPDLGPQNTLNLLMFM